MAAFATISNVDRRHELTVSLEGKKARLEDYLLDAFPTVSKMYLRELVRDERCEVNGRSENIGYRLTPNDLIEIWIDPARGTAMVGEELNLDIVYEDEDLVVVNKAAGMLVHPSHREKRGTLLNGLVHHLNRQGGKLIRPGLVHRLDKDTSGLMVVAKNARAHRILSRQFLKKQVAKRYRAVVEGLVADDEGTIVAPIDRHAEQKHWCVVADGKYSETRHRVIERREDTTLMELEPVTGRTNQLRIHCEFIGHPIVGDTRRGGRQASRLYLHAAELSFQHVSSGEIMSFSTPELFPILNAR